MKTKQLIVMSALAIAALTSCEKDLYDPNHNPNDTKVTDLIIPESFDWEMTKATTCNVTSDHSAQLAIYLDEACTEGNLLANVSVKAGTNMNLPLSILKNTQNVYIQYANAEGKRTVATAPVDANGNIQFAAPADSKMAITRAGDFEDMGRGILFYPKGDGGTIMFEDQYPALGDYDFNDFVAHYSAIIETSTDPTLESRGDAFVNKIMFTMTVVAIGGTKPHIPCLRLPFNQDVIATAALDAAGTISNEIHLVQDKDMSSKENAVFIFNGAEVNESKHPGSEFLNTEKGFVTSETKRVSLTVTFKNESALLSDLTSNLFDIFLCKPDKSGEIHMLGYGPAFDKNDHTSFVYDTTNNTKYKQEGSNLVWAISIPGNTIGHAFEKTNFLKAYPDFATWAQSGGANATEWYNQNINTEYLFK